MRRAAITLIKAVFLTALLGVLVCGVLSLSGCASPMAAATIGANSAREVLVEGKEVITTTCVPAYAAAGTAAQIERVDAKCLPAIRGYEALRSAWVVTVAAIGAAQAAQDGSTADVQRAALDLAAALSKLVAALRALGGAS